MQTARCCWIYIGIFLLTGLSGAQPIDLAKEESLQIRITLNESIIPVSDLLAQLSKRTGVPLSVERGLGDHKLTLFVKDRPAGEVLSKAASVMGYEWQKTEKGYQLYQSSAMREMEQKQRKLEAELGRKSLEMELKRWMEIAEKPFADVLKETERQWIRYQEISAEIQRLYDETSDASADRLAKLQSELEQLHLGGYGRGYNLLPNYLAGGMLRRLTREQWNDLWAGKPIFGSVKQKSWAVPLPAQSIQWHMDSERMQHKITSGSQLENVPFHPETAVDYFNLKVVLRYLDYDQSVRVMLNLVGDKGARFGKSSQLMGDARFQPDEEQRAIVSSALHKHWNSWQTAYEELLADDRLNVKSDGSSGSFEGTLASPRSVIQHLAEKAGFDVIADTYRMFALYAGSNRQLRDLLMSFAYSHVDNNYLLVRHQNYWIHQDREVPERILVPLERKAKQEGVLSLDDYAQLAAVLTRKQADALRESRNLNRQSVSFDLRPLEHTDALRFWQGLIPSQKQTALRFLAFDTLSRVQQERFLEVVFNDMWEGGGAIIEFVMEPHPDRAIGFQITEEQPEEVYEVLLDNHPFTTLQQPELISNIVEQIGDRTRVSARRVSQQQITMGFGVFQPGEFNEGDALDRIVKQFKLSRELKSADKTKDAPKEGK